MAVALYKFVLHVVSILEIQVRLVTLTGFYFYLFIFRGQKLKPKSCRSILDTIVQVYI